MRIFSVFLLLICSFSAYNQNLVPNPGFENYITLPCNGGASGLQENWEVLSGTPDIYSTLVPSSCFSSCSSTDVYSFGHQQPHSGDFMGGILTYGAGMGSSSQYRESFEVKLSSPLVVGHQYYAEMYVSLGDYASYASNNISLYFSVPHIDFNVSNWGPLYFTPHVSETSIVADTSNWVKISGTFIADSPAEYLLIANFTDDSLTNVFHINNTIKEDAYYFIDDILVKETCLSVGNDQTICKGDSAQVTASSVSFNGWALAADPSLILSTDSVFTVSPDSTTTYLALSDCDTFSIKIYVENAPPVLFLGNDTTICEGTVLVLQAAGLTGDYVWQDGSDKTYLNAKKAGIYWLKETNQCGTAMSQLKLSISPLPVFPWDMNPWFCEGSSIQLTELEPSLLAFQLDTNSGSFVSSTVIDTPGLYYMQVHNDCGYVSKNIPVEMRDCEVVFEMPNIVTPNGDQINDLLTPSRVKNISEIKTTLFNRWGQVIFETSDPEIKWDGALYTDGVYYWKVEYVDSHSGRNELQGFFQLIK